MTRVRNDLFDPREGLDRGRGKVVEAVWYLAKCTFFLSPLPWPRRLRTALLRAFGARIGQGVYIKPRVNIHFPWRLTIGDYSWIGEEVSILNFEPVTIGAHCCISQRVFLCTGNHDYTQVQMPYRNRPITVNDGVWIGAQTFVSPGAVIGTDSVIQACSLVSGVLPGETVLGGNPCRPMRKRWDGKEEVKSQNRG